MQKAQRKAQAQPKKVAAAKVAKKTPLKTTKRKASGLKARVAELIPAQREKMTKLNKEHGNKIVDKVDVGQILGGMRSIKAMVWDVSLLDANEGIRYRGQTLPELQATLPSAKRKAGTKKGMPTPEATTWFLMTGEIPTESQVSDLTAELHERSTIPAHVENVMKSFPKDMHPMSQLVATFATLQTESKFAKKYNTLGKKDLWEPAFEDALDVIAKAPQVAARIYNNTYGSGNTPATDKNLDVAANFNRMLGFPAGGKPTKPAHVDALEAEDAFDEYMRLYLSIHADHEGGNVSAHAARLVGSAHSDPYLAYSASMAGLAGPLHGLANQQCLDWNLKLLNRIHVEGKPLNQDTVRELAWDTLNSGQVIPGFGHAVLRKTDPRYTVQHEFGLKNLPKDELFELANLVYQVVPDVLTEHGKTKNPWPNVDAMSGVPLQYFGLKETNFYTVLFGVSRAIGVLSQSVIDRACGHPLERPKSLTTDSIYALAEKSTEVRQ